jgi:hypothetical protein
LPVLPKPIQPDESVLFPIPGGASDDDLKAFHDELDRLINGENPNGEFKSLFRGQSYKTFYGRKLRLFILS